MKNLSGVLFVAAKLMFIGTNRRLKDGDISGNVWNQDDSFMWADIIRGYSGMPNTESPDSGRFTPEFAEAFQPYYDMAVNMAPEIIESETDENTVKETEEEKAARETAEASAKAEAEEAFRAEAAKLAEEKAAHEAVEAEVLTAATTKAQSDSTSLEVLQQQETNPIDNDNDE